MSDRSRVSVRDLEAFCIELLSRAGLSPEDARTTTGALVTTDAMGLFTHGTKLIAGYLKKLTAGGYRTSAVPRIEREGPAWALVDGDSGLGQIGCAFSIRLAIAKARETGVAYVGLRNTGHIGAAGYYAAMAARQGCIAMVTGNDIPTVAAPGSRTAVLGSNPLAYGIPVTGGDPILLDIATAAVAGGKVYAAQQLGKPIPDNWLIGPDGRPTTDLNLFPHQAALAPMAGHKGYGIGLWCEIMSAILPGGAMTWNVGSWMFGEASQPSRHNASFTVIDVGALVPPEQFAHRIGTLIDSLHASPTAEGVDRVLLPGEREWEQYHLSLAEGIALPADVIQKLMQAGEPLGHVPAWLASASQPSQMLAR